MWKRICGELKRMIKRSVCVCVCAEAERYQHLTKPHCAMIWLWRRERIESKWNSKLANEFVCWQWLHLLTYKSSSDSLWEFPKTRSESEISGGKTFTCINTHLVRVLKTAASVAKFTLKFMFDSPQTTTECARHQAACNSIKILWNVKTFNTNDIYGCWAPSVDAVNNTHTVMMKVNFSILLHPNDHTENISLFQSNIDEL